MFYGTGSNSKLGKDTLKMARLKSSISQYVRVLTGENIPVKYNTKDEKERSYTDGEKVVIGGEITDETWNSVVGTALHEGSHICLTDFDFFYDFLENPESYVSDELYKKAEKLNFNHEAIKKIVKHIWNVVEDRRIDQWVYDNSPGYRKYYDDMYERYWNSEEINEDLKRGYREKDNGEKVDLSEENWNNYLFHTTNISNNEVYRNSGRLDGLEDIIKTIDLKNIRRIDTTEHAFKVALDVFEIMVDNIDEEIPDHMKKDPEQMKKEAEEALKEMLEEMGEDFLDQIDFAEGDIDKEEIDGETAIEIDIFSETQTNQMEVGGEESSSDDKSREGGGGHYSNSGSVPRTSCYVVRNISQKMVDQEMFGMISKNTNNRTYEAVREGMILGKRLGKKIQVRDDVKRWTNTRRRRGKLDGNMLAEIGYNNRLFKQTNVEEYGDAYLHISVDASGSMSGEKWKKTVKSVVAICKAADEVHNIEVTVSFRSTHNGRPLVLVGYDSSKNKFAHIRKFWPHLHSAGQTPEGLCYEATLEEIKQNANKAESTYFLNYSDGYPGMSTNSGRYGGESAIKHTARMVGEMRDEDVEVLGYFIGDDGGFQSGGNDAFERMYGKDSKFIPVTEVHSVSKTLNDKFLEK